MLVFHVRSIKTEGARKQRESDTYRHGIGFVQRYLPYQLRDSGFSTQGVSSSSSSLLSSALVGSEAIGQRREPSRRHHIVGARVRRADVFLWNWW